MAYRYTNTDKWSDSWFSGLNQLEKLLFVYLCDNCDIAGFIEVNTRRWAVDINCSKEELEGALEGLKRCYIYSIEKDCLYLRTFLRHQKNLPLNESNKAHLGILRRFELYSHKFSIEDINSFIEGASKGLLSPTGNGIGNGIGNEQVNNGNILPFNNDNSEDSSSHVNQLNFPDAIRDFSPSNTSGDTQVYPRGDNAKNAGRIPKKRHISDELWRTDFEEYKKCLFNAMNEILKDQEYVSSREKYFSNIDVRLTLDKSIRDFWGTEDGWLRKKKTTKGTPNWITTLKNSFEMNKVYKPRVFGAPQEPVASPTRQKINL